MREKKKSFSMWFIVRFSRAKRKQGMKGTTYTKKIEINGWVENIHDWKHVWAEKCIIYCMIYLFWHKFPLKIFFLFSYFFFAWGLIQWHEWLWIWGYWCMNLHWLWDDFRETFLCGFKELLSDISIDD